MKTNFSSKTNFVYEVSQDLDALALANNYHDWIISQFKDYLKDKIILEVGAGIGSFSKRMLSKSIVKPENLYLIEPSSNLHEKLLENLSEYGFDKSHLIKGFTYDKKDMLKGLKLEVAIYNNVFEHIDDDISEMKLMHNILAENGVVLSYTPATKWLYADFDKNIGHYRRYTDTEMFTKFKTAGYNDVTVFYRDFWGIFTWYINFKILKKQTINPKSMLIYDKYIFPILKYIDCSRYIKLGKNVLGIAKK